VSHLSHSPQPTRFTIPLARLRGRAFHDHQHLSSVVVDRPGQTTAKFGHKR
jgi:hypothetical protein